MGQYEENSMISTYATHPGLVRQNNEDCIRTDDSLGIYLLADGMGGHNAGEVASALVVDTVYAVLSSNIAHSAVDGLFDLMVDAMHAAHLKINAKARTSLSFMGMGTTLVAAIVRDGKAYIAHVGDSRAYHFHPSLNPLPSREGRQITPSLLVGEVRGEGRFQRITNDHTMGDQLLTNGIPRVQIPDNQFHNLTQAIGCGEPPIPDFNTVELNQGDMLLICADGLTDMLADNEIEAILANGDVSLDALAGNLIDAANVKGGLDNVSVVLVSS
jgi:protein phosphatase